MAFGQANTATLSGNVVDTQQRAVSGARVTVTEKSKSTQREIETDEAGAFVLTQLPASTYLLRIEHPGFGPVEYAAVVLHAGDQRSLRIALAPAQVGESVTVSSEAPLVSDSAVVATSVDRHFFENQPMNGRSFQSLIALAPGVTPAAANLVTPGQFSINGQRTNANYFTVDGVSANFATSASVTPYENGGGVPAFSALGSTNSLASVDAVQEFTIQTSTYAAEYGRQPGGQIAIVTRSGSSNFHGTLFEYFRNSVFDASNFFANAAGLPKPAIKLNDFGGTLGGPIAKRTFFFASYEGLRLRQPFVTVPLQVPSLTARAAATGPIRDILNAFPLPVNAPLASDPTTVPYQASFSNPSALNATSFRIDHQFNNRYSVFGRYNYAPSSNQERAKYCAASCVSDTSALTETTTLGLTAVFTPRLTNDLRLNFSRSRTVLSYFIDTFGGAVVPPASALYPGFTDGSKGYAYIQVDGVGDNTISDGLFVNNRQRQLNFVDTLSWTLGAHSLKFGFDARYLAPISDAGSYRRQFNPNSIQLLTQGLSSDASIVAPQYALAPRYTNLSAFAQDTWRLHPRLTLTAGLRWDVNPAPSEANGHLPYTVRDLKLLPLGDKFYNTDYKGFAPRLGISAQPFAQKRTVLRGGVGLFYDLGTSFLGNAFSTSLFPNSRSKTFSQIAYTDPAFAVQPAAVSLNPPYPRVFQYQPDYRLPYTVQYSLALEQPIGTANAISVSYVGSIGRRLGRVSSLRNPTPDFTRIDLVTNDGSSSYNSLQAQYRRRLSAGLQVLASYTFAKSLDTVSEESINNFQAPSSKLNPNGDRGPSSFDIRHAFNAALSYHVAAKHVLLRNFGIDGIVRSQSAQPINITTARDPFGLGFTTVSRPDLVVGQPLYLYSEALPGGKRLNPAAFDAATPVAQGRQGTLGRNVLRGFPVAQFDLSLRRTFQLTERTGLQVRADAFNLLNHANFSNPSGLLTNASFGRATSMLGTGLGGLNSLFQLGGPRSVQIALKLQF
ncbi:TonB-dependent receptor [Bryobacter aggregatus]|uniref:TonB-dependent receptor n=1 Tax=Bryobacter aggregatus TaxID=360054 RepID=UPI0004E23F58|nr:TonB-dependent receptor [Bryobacter aggregatus]